MRFRFLGWLYFSALPILCLAPVGCSSGSAEQNEASKPNDDQVGAKNDADDARTNKPGGKPADETARDSTIRKQAAPKGHDKKRGKPNRLAEETSPYLLMHAYNPVDWFSWGEEAFAKAKKENKLIFLSIGYSSCYWCHVMERESFMDEEIAKYLNEHFVCIKVDREERPDVDDIYMTAVQSISGRGGWPMSMFLVPDAKPFFGGTYFPARTGDRGGRIGFLELVQRVQKVWEQRPGDVRSDSERLTTIVKRRLIDQPKRKVELSLKLIAGVQAALEDEFDPEHGGFGYSAQNPRQPKFPSPSRLLFLLERSRRSGDEEAQKMLEVTLEKMAGGGIRDHLGGGFHRYSVDRFWHIPHFEKMLYDNGQLATVYAEAYELTGRENFQRVVREMLDFVLREMTGEHGGFYAAIDAETDAEEGKIYRWTVDEFKSILGDKDFELFASIYGADGRPNFERRYYVPMLARPLAEIAADRETTEAELDEQLRPLREKLLAVRDKRERPLTDTKIITAWNGLMIRGFADGGRILKEERYVEAAEKAADFVLATLRTKDGRLLRTFRKNQAKLNAYVDDYAYFVDGLIAIYRATGEKKWLIAADALTAKQIELFWDEENGGFFFTSDDHETLIARAKKPLDNVRPSGNSVTCSNLIFLARELDKPEYLEHARETVSVFAALLQRQGAAGAMPRTAIAMMELLETAEKPNPQGAAAP